MPKRYWALLTVLLLGIAWLMGCVAPQQAVPELTPEQIQAQQDSIAKANEKELKKWRMFAFDKIKEKNWDKSREYFWKVVKLDVKHEYNDWARIYQTFTETDQIDSAQAVLHMGLEYHPDDPFLNATLGFYLKAQGEYESALDHYRIAIRSEQENVEYIRKEAELLEILGLGEEAIGSYELVLELNPADQEAKDRYTSLLKQFRDPEEYIKSLEADVEANLQDLNKHLELIVAYVDQALNEKLIAHVDRLAELDLTSLEAIKYKAGAYENLNDLNAAIKTHQAVLEIEPDNYSVMLRIADDFRLLNKFSTARTWVLKARMAGDNPPEADYVLGQVYESAGDKCSGGRGLEFDDKLVYVIAYGLYDTAAKGSDYSVKDKASRRLDYLEQFVPQYSDWFMNKTKKSPATDCYGWIKSSWPEAKYIIKFLDKLSQSKG